MVSRNPETMIVSRSALDDSRLIAFGALRVLVAGTVPMVAAALVQALDVSGRYWIANRRPFVRTSPLCTLQRPRFGIVNQVWMTQCPFRNRAALRFGPTD